MIKSHYNRVFDFGCSFTCYRWLSWSDIIGLNTDADIIHKHSSSGSGVKHLYFNLQNVCKNQNLGATDLVLIQIPNLCRTEKIMQRSWTNMGDFELEYRGFAEAYFPEEFYGPQFRFYVLDHFAETMFYLEMIRMIIMSLPCDVEVIQTDELRIYGILLREYLEDKGLNDLPDDHRFEWSKLSSRGIYDYSVKEIKDLATLFEVAAENKCVMEAWW